MQTTDTNQPGEVKEESETLAWQLQRIPGSVVESFTPEQRDAVITAIDASVSPHPVDIRFKLPLIGHFVTVIADHEQRDRKRRKQEEKTHPLVTLGNFLFSIIFASIFSFGILALGLIFLLLMGRITP